jgi:hypothetical protein
VGVGDRHVEVLRTVPYVRGEPVRQLEPAQLALRFLGARQQRGFGGQQVSKYVWGYA